jgi:tetratricopeptide (TPR) repeat protein
MHDISTVVRDLAGAFRRGDVAVFCGAGISRNSGLPVVAEFLTEIFQLAHIASLEVRDVLEQLPFEAVMHEFAWGGDIRALLDVFNGTSPSATHRLLAGLATKGHLRDIVTTNFDTLIEIALEDACVEYVAPCDASEFAAIDWNRERARLVKLHGSVDRKESVIITIDAVAKKTFAKSREAVIDWVFRDGPHSTVLVLGYSCSDVFDVSPAIGKLADTRKDVVFVDHADMPKARLENINVKAYKNPFALYSRGYRLYYDTDVLIAELAEQLDLSVHRNATTIAGEHDWKAVLKGWTSEYNNPQERLPMRAVEGKLLLLSGKHSEALTVFSQVETLLAGFDQPGIRGEISNLLGIAYDRVHQYHEARIYFGKALLDFDRIGDKSRQAQAMGNIGGIDALRGSIDDALKAHIAALHLARESGDRQTEQIQLDSLGVLMRHLGQYSDAVDLHNMSIAIAEDIGRVHGLGIAYGNLGLAYRYLKEYSNAAMCHVKSLSIAKAIGDRQMEGNQLGNLGLVFSAQGELDDAMEYYSKALTIAEEISDMLGVATQSANVGFLCSRRHDFDSALRYHSRALNIEESLGRKAGVARQYDNLAGVYFELGRFNDAVESAEAGLRLYEELYGSEDDRFQELHFNLDRVRARMKA